MLADDDDAARWRAFVADDATVSAWLSEIGPADAPGVWPAQGPSRFLLHRLADDLVVGAPPAGARGAAASIVAGPSAEALVLVESIERMRSFARLAGHFGESLQAARLEAARELAYGAGHEINNPLANIATRAQSLLLEERDAERRRRLATIVDQSFRARDMIGGLMLFARPPKPAPDEIGVGALIDAVAEAVGPLAGARGVRMESRPGSEQVTVIVDRGQIEEALRALVTNAVEAAADGGSVVIAAEPVAGDPAWCEITVVDDGAGMDDATIRRAFDPFFCGREAGRGAGLGLSKAWRFIEASGGSVTLSSRVGAGTTAAVRLPRGTARKVTPNPPV
ncbi:MAG: HAMP domain-containing sensor histidine kinase [Planctomycetia bacterium]